MQKLWGYKMHLKFKKLHYNAQLPVYATDEAAGMDVFACLENPVILQAGEAAAIPTGIAMELPQGYEAQFRGRSGLAFKHAVFSYNGTIDSDYRGEIKGLLINHSRVPFTIEPGMRIGQMVINAAVVRCRPEFVDDLNETKRGEGGFGSTGLADILPQEDDEYLKQWKKDVGYVQLEAAGISASQGMGKVEFETHQLHIGEIPPQRHSGYVHYTETMGDDPVDQEAVKDSLLNVALGKK